jgi:ABC-type transport system involved in multi-copper enzyme maturation permease subunit
MKKRKLHFRSVVSLANTRLSVKTAAIVIASSTRISALLGIFRDRSLNTMYYDTYPAGLDAYTAAFTVPDFLFFIITSYSNDDFKYGTVRNKIISGYNRKQIYLSKLIVNVSASVAVQLVYSLSVLLFSSLVLGFNKSSSFELYDFTNILSLILSSVLIQVTTYSLLTLINVKTQKNAKTIIWFLATNMIISFALSSIMIILSEFD